MSEATMATLDWAIDVAADKFSGQLLPQLEDSEYLRGIVEVLADTFELACDCEDPDCGPEEIWGMISAVHHERSRRARADALAARYAREIYATVRGMDVDDVELDQGVNEIRYALIPHILNTMRLRPGKVVTL